MRRIGSISDQTDAKRFCDYLVTLSVDASADENSGDDGAVWDIWIRDEAHVQQAREEFAAFQAAPQEAKYQVQERAEQIRDERIADSQRRLKHQRNFGKEMTSGRGMSGRGMSGPLAGASVRQQNIPITIGIIVVSVIASFTAEFGRPKPSRVEGQATLAEKCYYGLSFVDRRDYATSGGDAFANVRDGEVWRLVTPMFLHGSTFHLAFNMLWIFFLGSAIERLHGSLFMLVLVLLTEVSGTMLQVMLPPADTLPPMLHGLAGSPFAIGASGAVYGLFGFLWIRPMVDANYPIRMVPANVYLMLGWLVLCMTPIIPFVANGAHLGGLIAGMAAGYLATVSKSGAS